MISFDNMMCCQGASYMKLINYIFGCYYLQDYSMRKFRFATNYNIKSVFCFGIGVNVQEEL